VRHEHALLLERLRPAARLKWSPVENFHITTKFIGDWSKNRLEELAAALRSLPASPPIQIAVGGLGWFPNPHAPRVFWAGVKAAPALAELARSTDQALGRVGLAPETRAFSPHLTLARIKEQVPLDPLRQAIAALPVQDFGEFAADRFHLYLSEPGPGGSIYTPLEEFVFARS
jgi:2'-5' RNA ligase